LQNIDNELKNVNRSLKTPYSIKAAEAFSQWLSCVKVSNIDFAIRSFEKWIEQDPTHLWNIFWAGTLYNALWKTKKAREYLNAALKISLSTNNPIIKNIYYELAKLETKQLNLKVWKDLLEGSMSVSEFNLEIYLMQIDILLKLWENVEAEVLINKLFNQIITWDYNTKWVKNRKGVARFLKWKTESFVNILIKNWETNELIKIIKFLEIIWYNNITQDVFLYFFENYREWFYENKIQLKNHIKGNNKISRAIKNFANKNYTGWNSEPYFLYSLSMLSHIRPKYS
jgi:tetratricopeptide (TPR) repeat protein